MMAGRTIRGFDAQLVAEIEDRHCTGGSDRRAIYVPGASRWYALQVEAQREDHAEAWLRLRGVYAFHPVMLRQVRVKGVMRDYARRYLPGYVFARFPGDPWQHLVADSPFIHGALRRSDGEWGILEPRKLRAIHSMRKIDAEAEAMRRGDMARARLQAGDRALFRCGPFADLPCEVIELQGDAGVRVRFRLFGREVLTSAATDTLISLNQGG